MLTKISLAFFVITRINILIRNHHLHNQYHLVLFQYLIQMILLYLKTNQNSYNLYLLKKKKVKHVKKEVFTDNIFVYTVNGDRIELPKGATLIDLAYRIHTNIGNTMIGGFVNDEFKPVDYILQNNDRVRIITDELSYGPNREWIDKAQTTLARRRISEFNKIS